MLFVFLSCCAFYFNKYTIVLWVGVFFSNFLHGEMFPLHSKLLAKKEVLNRSTGGMYTEPMEDQKTTASACLVHLQAILQSAPEHAAPTQRKSGKWASGSELSLWICTGT